MPQLCLLENSLYDVNGRDDDQILLLSSITVQSLVCILHNIEGDRLYLWSRFLIWSRRSKTFFRKICTYGYSNRDHFSCLIGLILIKFVQFYIYYQKQFLQQQSFMKMSVRGCVGRFLSKYHPSIMYDNVSHVLERSDNSYAIILSCRKFRNMQK